jgi:hypothetical protein
MLKVANFFGFEFMLVLVFLLLERAQVLLLLEGAPMLLLVEGACVITLLPICKIQKMSLSLSLPLTT